MSNKSRGGAPVGNTNATKGRLFTDQLRKLIAQEELTMQEKNRRLYRAANSLLASAAAGEDWALRMLAERLDGKPVQGVELSSPDGTMSLFDPAQLRNLTAAERETLRALLGKAVNPDE